jgi:transcription initiation factor IIE alpha subunit
MPPLSIRFVEWAIAQDEKLQLIVETTGSQMLVALALTRQDVDDEPVATILRLDVRHLRRLVKALDEIRRFAEEEDQEITSVSHTRTWFE